MTLKEDDDARIARTILMTIIGTVTSQRCKWQVPLEASKCFEVQHSKRSFPWLFNSKLRPNETSGSRGQV